MTYAFMKYWVEGEQEAIHTLFNAFADNEGFAINTLEKLGVNADEYDTERVEWCNPKVEDKDGYSVLYFEEFFPNERGTIIDQLMDEDKFKGKLTNLYYYAEELANADLCETNDEEGKYFPYHLIVGVVDNDGCYVDDGLVYMKDEQELVNTIREKYQLSEEFNSIDTLKRYFDDSNEYDHLFVHDIEVIEVVHPSDFGFHIISSKWEETGTFFEGLAAVKDSNEKWGFINQKFEVVSPCQWEGVWDFSEGLAAVQDTNCEWGFIDKTGKVVIPCQWEDVQPFRKGIAKVQNDKGKWVKIDKAGNIVKEG